MIRAVCCAVLLMAMSALPVCADPFADGNAAMTALGRGDYDSAIRLFTHAIDSGRLAGDNLELAYLNRGKAYAAKGDLKDGIVDLQRATKLRPDDADAANALEAALSTHGDASPTEASEPAPADPWGVLRSLAGRFYWYAPAGSDPRGQYLEVGWQAPDQTLLYFVHSRDGLMQAVEYHLDAQSGELLVAGIAGQTTWYGTATPTRSGWTIFADFNGTPDRVTYTVAPDGSIGVSDQGYASGAWQTPTTTSLIEASRADVVAAGLRKK
jgi:hypothetical protein